MRVGPMDKPPNAGWEVPEPLSVSDIRLDDETLTVVRRHGNPDSALRLVLSHANGFAIDLYYPFWSLLAAEFDLMVYDLRNHGWNSVGDRRHHNIPTLIHDHDLILDSIDRRYGTKPTVGVYHSLSTLIALLSFTNSYSALVLFDPPLCKPTSSETEFDEAAERGAAMARRRCERFRSEEEFADLLRYMPGFTHVLPGVKELMASTILKRTVDGDAYELRCPREFEAQIAEYVRSFAPLLDLDSPSCPTKVVGGDPTLPYAFMPSFDLRQIGTVDYDFVTDATHLLQLEKPEDCVAILRQFLERTGLL